MVSSPPNALATAVRSIARSSLSNAERLATNRLTPPSSIVATALMFATWPNRSLSKLPELTGTRTAREPAKREVIENGKKVVCRQAMPPGSVMIGAMTLTS